MTNGAIAPLYPLGPPQPAAFLVTGGAPNLLAPLSWYDWVVPKPSEVQPNPAPNRPRPSAAMNLTPELAGLTALARSLQETTEKVTAAHSQFLSNQTAALDQIKQISDLLQAFTKRN